MESGERLLWSFEEIAEEVRRGGRDEMVRAFGKKAISLIDLASAGVRVPAGWCVGAGQFRTFLVQAGLGDVFDELSSTSPENLPRALEYVRTLVERGGVPEELSVAISSRVPQSKAWAVRSSGSKEDLGESSFAGLYESVLNVRRTEDVVAAIRRCWLSVFSERVLIYCRKNKIDFAEMAMGVIIQEMVPSEKSGVLFTVNPLSGRDTEMLVEACFGVGEALVGGEVTPDLYLYDWFREAETGRTINEKRCAHVAQAGESGTAVVALSGVDGMREVLSKAEVETLVHEGLRIQRHLGLPVDVEWAQAAGEFHFVQARPITKINTSFTDVQWTSADFKDGGVSSAVCSRMMWSLYDLIWETTMPSYLRSVRLLEGDDPILWGDMFYGRPYWNATAVKSCVATIPGYVERHFDEDIGVQVGYDGMGRQTHLTPASILRGLKVLRALRKSFEERIRYNEEIHPRLSARIEELDGTRPEEWSDEKLFAFFPGFILEDYFKTESSYFLHIFDNSNLQTLFKTTMRPYRDRVNYLNLVVGIEGISHMDPILDQWDVSRLIGSDADARRWWHRTPVSEIVVALRSGDPRHGLGAVREYVEKYKYHSTRELDITVPNFRDDPSFVISNLKLEIECGEEHDPRRLGERQRRTFEEEARKLRAVLPFVKRRSVMKELERMRLFLWWREELRDVSTRMYDQIRRFALEVGRRLAARGCLDVADDVFHLPVEDVIATVSGKMVFAEARGRMLRHRAYYECFRSYQPPADLNFQVAPSVEGSEASDVLRGIACSPGVVTARVRVVRSIAETSEVGEGEILVTRFTDPGWTPVFGRIAGVVTETGGVLSHAAVIAREYGIPAVLAVPDATRRLQTGQTVTLDGLSGRILLQ